MERPPEIARAHESERGPTGREQLEHEIELLEEAYGGIEDEEYKLSIRERIEDAGRELLSWGKSIGMYSALVAALLSANHVRTRNDIEEVRAPDGTITYEHEDRRTTELIEYISGMREPTPALRHDFLVAIASVQFSQSGEPVPSYSSDTTAEEILSDVTQLFIRTYELPYATARAEAEELLFMRGIEVDQNPDLYLALWRMQQHTGAPRIRLQNEGKRHFLWGQLPAHFDIYTNTIHVDVGEMLPTFIAESAHSKQANDAPVAFFLRSYFESVNVLVQAIIRGEDFTTYRQVLYDTPGSYEHEAHSIIEPQLEAQMGDTEIRVRRNTEEDQ